MASRPRLAHNEPLITPFYLRTATNDTYLKIELQYTQHFTNIALLDSHVYVGRESLIYHTSGAWRAQNRIINRTSSHAQIKSRQKSGTLRLSKSVSVI